MTHYQWAVLILLGLNLLAKLLDVRVHWGKLPSGLKWVPAAKVFDYYDCGSMHQCGGELFIKARPGFDAPNVGDYIQKGLVRRRIVSFGSVWKSEPPEYTVKLDQHFDYEDYDDGS